MGLKYLFFRPRVSVSDRKDSSVSIIHHLGPELGSYSVYELSFILRIHPVSSWFPSIYLSTITFVNPIR